MSLFFKREIDAPFGRVLSAVEKNLRSEGFELLTNVEVQNDLKERLGDKFRRCVVLASHMDLLADTSDGQEQSGGPLLPSNVIVQESADRTIEVSAFDASHNTGVNEEGSGKGSARTRRIKAKLESAIIGLS